MIRLGVGLTFEHDDPEEMAQAYVRAGYTAAVCPPLSLSGSAAIRAVERAFARHDVLLAEVGCWNNLLAPDEEEREQNLQANMEALALADEVGALCCVNIAGSYNPTCWDGPHPNNLSRQALAAIVANTRLSHIALESEHNRQLFKGERR